MSRYRKVVECHGETVVTKRTEHSATLVLQYRCKLSCGHSKVTDSQDPARLLCKLCPSSTATDGAQ